MPNAQKREYVDTIVSLLKDNPQFVVVGFAGTTHKRLEEFRGRLRALAAQEGAKPRLMILKNSLFKVALEKFGGLEELSAATSGKSAILFLPNDWMGALKTFKTFAKEEEGMGFRVGLIDGEVHTEAGLVQLADLPGRDELAVRIIRSLRAPSTKLVYSLKFNAIQLVTVLKNAAGKTVN